MYYHIDKSALTIIAGPHTEQSDYIKSLTSCGNPELLDLSLYDLVPQVFPPLTEGNQYSSATTVYEDRVEMGQEPVPAPPVPQSLTRRQGKLILLQYGLLDDIEAIIATLPRAAQIEWQDAMTFERTNPVLTQVADAASMTSEQLDEMFREGSRL